MIEVHGVSKTFRPGGFRAKQAVAAVRQVSLRCEPGRVFALLGPNGSGKTTLLRMIASLITPDEGTLQVAGFDTRQHGREVRRRLGFLTNAALPHSRLTPWETMDYFGGLHGMGAGQIQQRRDLLFERLDISDFARRPVGGLSAGMRQRVAVARTLLHDPEVVVLDEATAGLDVLAAGNLLAMVRECRQAGRTVLFSTHIMGEVTLLADDVGILHQGRLVYSGTLQDLNANRLSASLEEEFVRLLEGRAA